MEEDPDFRRRLRRRSLWMKRRRRLRSRIERRSGINGVRAGRD